MHIYRVGMDLPYRKKEISILSRKDAKLLQQADAVLFAPMFSNLSICNASNIKACEGYVLSRWWNTHETSCIRTLHRDTRHYFIAFSNQIVNHNLIIGKTCKHDSMRHFCALKPRWDTRHDPGRKQFL